MKHMCYAIPGKVKRIVGNKVVLDYFGEERHYINDFLTLKVDDYVYAQGGFIIQLVPKLKAKAILEAWEEMFFKLKEVDRRMAVPQTAMEDISPSFKEIMLKAKKGQGITKQEALSLLGLKDEKEKQILYETANELREKKHGNACCVHGIIEFSNHCQNHCSYCGINCDNKKLERYRIDPDEIVKIAGFAVNSLGFKALVLQSGEDPWYTKDMIIDIVKKIRKNYPALIFLSVGNRNEFEYEEFYKAGVRAALYRFETSNPFLYSQLRASGSYEQRITTLKALHRMGFIIATGSLIGLPGQTNDDLINDILLAKESYAEMYSSGPFIPHPDTKLANTPPVPLDLALKYIAVNRLIDPDGNILVTTALQTMGKEDGTRKALLAGGNSLMVNLTPLKYKIKYDIYPKRATVDQCVAEQINYVVDLLFKLGRAPTDLGVS